MANNYIDLPLPDGGIGSVTSLNSLTGALTLVAGSGISVTPSGSNITITNLEAGGSVTSVSVVSANGFAGTVANPSTTPALTLTTSVTGILKGNSTAISAATSGTDYSPGTSGLSTGILKSTTTTGVLSIAVAGDFPTLNQNTTGTASNITAASNSSITTLSSLSLPYAQVTGGPGGTVTSVGLSSPGVVYTVSGSPVTTSGTLALNLVNQTANAFLAGPTSGGAVAPTFRGIVNGDLTSVSTLSSLSLPTTQLTGTLQAAQAPAYTGDASSSAGALTLTLATVNSNVGSFGSSTSIPTFTVNGKGLITAASSNVVIAPAGTVTGTTLASNVVTSSLTSVGTLTGLSLGGGLTSTSTNTVTVNNAASPYTILSTSYLLLVDTSGGAVTLNLPNPANRQTLMIKDKTGSFGTNNCTLARFGSETIEGLAANLILSAGWGCYTFEADGTNWFKTSNACNVATATFTGSGTWNAPAGILSVIATGRSGSGGGAGGGSGSGGSTATAGGGGGGGGAGGAACSVTIPVSIVPGTAYTVTIGAGGNGGSGGTASAANPSGVVGVTGLAGAAGGNTTFGTIAKWSGGEKGGVGTPNATFSSGSTAGVGGSHSFGPGGNTAGTGGASNAAGGNATAAIPQSLFAINPNNKGNANLGGSAGGVGGGGGGGGGGVPTGGDLGSTIGTPTTPGTGGASGANGGNAGTGAAGTVGAGGGGGSGGGGGGLLASTGSQGGNGSAGLAGTAGQLVITWNE